ncbi:hypothetical protein V9J34_001351 [Salmonella enterica]|nr:hypothetical protein [Salmonella enterica subsp. enterica]
MVITILDEQSNVVEIIPACIPHDCAIEAAKSKVREAALRGILLTAVDEDGDSVFDEEFQTFLQLIPHGRRIAANMMDRMARNPAELHMLLSGSPQIPELISCAITDYFEKQIAIGKEYLSMPECKRQKVREQLLGMIFTKSAA